jgi:hypothetical protein
MLVHGKIPVGTHFFGISRNADYTLLARLPTTLRHLIPVPVRIGQKNYLRSASPLTCGPTTCTGTLPITKFYEIVTKHNGSLNNVRFSNKIPTSFMSDVPVYFK